MEGQDARGQIMGKQSLKKQELERRKKSSLLEGNPDLSERYTQWLRQNQSKQQQDQTTLFQKVQMYSYTPVFFQQTMNTIFQEKHQCLGCIKYLYQNQPIPNTNQSFSMLNCRLNEQVLQQKLKSKICALLNEGGGYLFIMDEQKQFVTGDQWLHLSANQWLRFASSQKQYIFPQRFRMEVSEVEVIGRSKTIQKEKSIIRVSVRPDESKYTFFSVKKIQNYKPSYACYFLNQSDKTKIDDVHLVTYTCYYYNIILVRFNKYKPKSNNKYPIIQSSLCVPAKESNRDSFKQLAQAMEVIEQKKKQQKIIKPELFTKVQDVQPEIKYKYQSLFILKNDAEDGIIEILIKQLRQKKMVNFKFMKPFMNHRNNSTRSIWFMTHDYSFQSMKDAIEICLPEKKNNTGPAFIACTKYLKIQQQIWSKLEGFHESLQQFYGPKNKPVGFQQKGKNTWNFCYSFQSYQESVFAFIFLENLRIRSLFASKTIYDKMKIQMQTNEIGSYLETS